MSQAKVWSCDRSTVSRTKTDGSQHYGDGGSKRLYVGRTGSFDYDAFLHFAVDWSGVGSIASAVLTLTTDDGQGVMPLPASSDAPKIVVSRLTSSFTQGNNADGHFDSTDYVAPHFTTSGQKTPNMAKNAGGLTNIDITGIVKAWAPSSVAGGSGSAAAAAARNLGIALRGTTDGKQAWSGWSRMASDASLRPYITLTYNLGPTTPFTPTNLSPVGEVDSIGAFQGDFDDPRATDTLDSTDVQVYAAAPKAGTAATNDAVTVTAHGFVNGQEVWFHSLTGGAGLSLATRYYVRDKSANAFHVALSPGGAVVNILTAYSALTVGSPLWSLSQPASDTETFNARSFVIPMGLNIKTRTTYKWRMRQTDQEAKTSAWTALVDFSVTNTNPDPPTLEPADSTQETLTNSFRGGTFSDPDEGDTLLAFQVQLSAYPEGDAHWNGADSLLWDTGKKYVATGSESWETNYGGQSLAAGTYYWRARQWDNHDGVSDWAYTSLVLTADFDAEPGSQDTIQIDPHAPWRIRIREMKFNAIGGALTGDASTDVLTTAMNHGFAAGRKVRFASLTGGTGLFVGKDYWVVAAGLGAKTFKVAESEGGTAVGFSTNVTAGSVTAVTTRGPGNVVAILENAANPGASIVFNSPGEAHFTLPVDHPQISVIEPKQVHYGIDFYSQAGWRETFAGLVDDIDATENDVVFPCVDYLGLLDYVLDERYYPSDPNRSYTKGGSYYANVSIHDIVLNQLQRAVGLADSPVGFIGIGSIETMNEKVSIYSTMQPALAFISGLLDSHAQGKDRRTRIWVQRTTGGGYQFTVKDNSGTRRDNLRLAYGELVQGYRVIPFGKTWASVLHAIGRTRDGIRVMYKTKSAPGIDPKVWGRFARAVIMDNVSDENDLDRRAVQAAIQAGKLGRSIALAVRVGLLKPLDGYNICDEFPVRIVHGAVNTTRFGSGYWVCLGVTWEGNNDGSQNVTPTLVPREDVTSPADDLIDNKPISPQAEWQVGWTPPDPLKASSKYWLDQSTGKVYVRDDDTLTGLPVTGTA